MGNRHHKESSRETKTHFRDPLVAEDWNTDFSVACRRDVPEIL